MQAGGNGPHTGMRSDFIMLAITSAHALAGLTPSITSGAAGSTAATVVTHAVAVPRGGATSLKLRCSTANNSASAGGSDSGGTSALRVELFGEGSTALLALGVAACSPTASTDGNNTTWRSSSSSSSAVEWAQSQRLEALEGVGRVVLRFTLEPGTALYSFSFSLGHS